MARFFMTGTNIDGGRAVIRGQDAGHIRVLRLRPGEDVVICDGRGTDYRCRLVRSTAEEAEAEVIEVTPCRGEPDVAVHVFAGYPKGERAELLVQKCVEAGAQEIDFFDCERCIARPDGRAMAKRLERLARVSESAAQQSGRGIVPRVGYIPGFVEMLDAAVKYPARLFMYETGPGRAPLKAAIEASLPLTSAAVITGSEGGFTAAEAKMAAAAGFTLCSMGKRILRCETAPVLAVSSIMYATGNL